jgi:hypothetical protein
MKKPYSVALGGLILALASLPAAAQTVGVNLGGTNIQHVLLISIDGMHALDLANCIKGVGGKGGPTCPNLAQLTQSGTTYPQASTTKPSDSFPGMVSLATGGTPRSAEVFYDVSYDRVLSPPAQTTPYGITGGANLCPGTIGTQIGFDEELDTDLTQLNGGGGINPAYLPRDPNNKCAPVYPHSFLRVNTIFEVIKANGGYTAWSDKHPSYEFLNGPSGSGLNDFYGPEINSNVVGLPTVAGCGSVPDPTADLTAWTNSFQNIQCYDTLKVQAVLNWIDGRSHDGTKGAPMPAVFGMNFQAVSVGQKLVEGSTTGGYLDAAGTPSPSLLSEIQYVDTSIGQFLAELKKKSLSSSTLVIITAKHGQSPIDINRLLRIPGDNKSDTPPSSILGNLVAQADEDDVSLLWLTDQTQTASAVQMLEMNAAAAGIGQIYWGAAVSLMFNDPATDSRTPDIIITPNVGVVYTGGKGKVSEHGGFANDDTNVLMLVSNPALGPQVYTGPVRTAQVAPTILKALGINPTALQAVQKEQTTSLPGLPF